METNQSLEQVLESMNLLVYKKKKSIFKSLIYFLLGIVFLSLNSSFPTKINSIIPSLLFISGFIFFVLGMFIFFFRKKSFYAIENNQELKSYQIYFDLQELNKLIHSIENGNLKELKTLKPSTKHALKLNVMVTRDARLCFSQIVSFVSNEYVNMTPVKHHTAAEAQELLEIVNR